MLKQRRRHKKIQRYRCGILVVCSIIPLDTQPTSTVINVIHSRPGPVAFILFGFIIEACLFPKGCLVVPLPLLLSLLLCLLSSNYHAKRNHIICCLLCRLITDILGSFKTLNTTRIDFPFAATTVKLNTRALKVT
jgi:hypothetical protein